MPGDILPPQHLNEKFGGAHLDCLSDHGDDLPIIRDVAHMDDASAMIADLESDAIPVSVRELHDALELGHPLTTGTRRETHGSVSSFRFA